MRCVGRFVFLAATTARLVAPPHAPNTPSPMLPARGFVVGAAQSASSPRRLRNVSSASRRITPLGIARAGSTRATATMPPTSRRASPNGWLAHQEPQDCVWRVWRDGRGWCESSSTEIVRQRAAEDVGGCVRRPSESTADKRRGSGSSFGALLNSRAGPVHWPDRTAATRKPREREPRLRPRWTLK
jgi:hypothetical protein